jgi:hypothetical protein
MKSGAIAWLSLLSCVVVAQDTKQDETTMKNCAMHDEHQRQSHHSIVQNHGDQAMGFPTTRRMPMQFARNFPT